MIVLTVLYPKTADSTFDHEYYLSKHIPMVRSFWTEMGLTQVELLRGASAMDGSAPAFELVGMLHFVSQEALTAALEVHGQAVIDDVRNFSSVAPTLQVSTPVGE